MIGQWLGKFQGTNTGSVTLNVDEKKNTFSGVVYFIESDPMMPSVVVHFEFNKKDIVDDIVSFKSSWINPLQPGSFTETSWDQVKSFYPNSTFPRTIEVRFEHCEQLLKVSAKTDINTEVLGELLCSMTQQPSSLESTPMTWEEFKKFILDTDQEFLFRGQNEPWKLQTGFHRRERYDLTRYQQNDIPQLHRALSAQTYHVFDLGSAQENGAFLNLAQHHGYPTPLLDWTYSPYVAAFFAFRGISEHQVAVNGNNNARIYIFDANAWRSSFIQNQNMLTGQLHLSVIDLLAIENNRMVPQQASTTVTNVADIESYIQLQENNSGKTFLRAIDIPWTERKLVTRELRLMGLTAGSIFPGLDGTCEELKDKMFD
ncbi:FRG domain-containing protein [Photobacterium sanguinicancri]|uniref:FRG domain-containing protein n=1 Tax=Photobacterium sanguinicancri TaxID=875932 RepID=UPI0021C365EE|nr:FRG domain-containing protein [Photobacterium sanguinicancri]